VGPGRGGAGRAGPSGRAHARAAAARAAQTYTAQAKTAMERYQKAVQDFKDAGGEIAPKKASGAAKFARVPGKVSLPVARVRKLVALSSGATATESDPAMRYGQPALHAIAKSTVRSKSRRRKAGFGRPWGLGVGRDGVGGVQELFLEDLARRAAGEAGKRKTISDHDVGTCVFGWGGCMGCTWVCVWVAGTEDEES
jgi:hypothetical protein